MTNDIQCCNAEISTSQLSSSWSFTRATLTQTDGNTYVRKTFYMSMYEASPNTNTQTGHSSEIPDIRQKIKPWYFPNADTHNNELAINSASDFMQEKNNAMSYDFQKILLMIKNMNGIFDANTNACCPHSIRGAIQESSQKMSLSEIDKERLEGLHHFAEKKHIETKYVSFIATQLTIDKLSADSSKQTQPSLNKDYFSDEIAKMNIWGNEINGLGIHEQLKEFFT